jgi:hypothetical protein
MTVQCRHCDDTGWVCEAHPDRPHEGEHACSCGAAGMPCQVCNPCGGIDQPPRLPPGFQVDITAAD